MPRPTMSTPQMRQPGPRYPGTGAPVEIRPGVTVQVYICQERDSPSPLCCSATTHKLLIYQPSLSGFSAIWMYVHLYRYMYIYIDICIFIYVDDSCEQGYSGGT